MKHKTHKIAIYIRHTAKSNNIRRAVQYTKYGIIFIYCTCDLADMSFDCPYLKPALSYLLTDRSIVYTLD